MPLFYLPLFLKKYFLVQGDHFHSLEMLKYHTEHYPGLFPAKFQLDVFVCQQISNVLHHMFDSLLTEL